MPRKKLILTPDPHSYFKVGDRRISKQRKRKNMSARTLDYFEKTIETNGVDYLSRGKPKRQDVAERARLEQELIAQSNAGKKVKLPSTGEKLRFDLSNKGPEKYRTPDNNYEQRIGNGWKLDPSKVIISKTPVLYLPDIWTPLDLTSS